MKRIRNTFCGFFLMAAALLMALLYTGELSAQVQTPVPVVISKQKIASEGKVYYMHQVMKGQTLYSISRAYNVTVDHITRENDIADNGIREGQMLRIPASAGQTSAGEASFVRQEKAVGQLPPQGQEVTAVQRPQAPYSPATQDERYIYHRVKRGETLSSVAGEYGISVRDLKKENKKLLFPHEGDVLLIPRRKISGQLFERSQTTLTDSLPDIGTAEDTLVAGEQPEIFTTMAERTVITRLHGSVKVAVLLPFFLKENSVRTYTDSTRKDAQGNRIYREVNKPEGSIYEGSLPFLEAYEGILLAVDSLRSLGLTVEIDAYDTGADSIQIRRLLWSDMLSDVDLIIGPVFSYNVEQISGWAEEHEIPFVSPVPLRDRNITVNKPTMYRVFPSENIIQDVMAGELRSHRESNIIFVYADSAMYDPSTVRLWEKVKSVTSEMSPDDTTTLIPYYFTGIASRRNAYSDLTSFDSVLDQERENIIVLASTNTPVISSAFSTLHGLSRKYNIKVIGYPDIRSLETVDLRYYYDLELFIPAESYIDFDQPATKAFSMAFMKKFKTEPMAESFAWRGFDIAWYFIGGIAMGGKEFLKDPGIFNPSLLCFEPDFRRDSRNNGYENNGLFILHYKKDMTIEIKRPRVWQVEGERSDRQELTSPYSDSLRRNQVR